ncbi:MAG TPA: trypsin-like peptidase domain-containing protein [Firmicutes bacterium]|nr:trypsin-like peptidase domain-containing protein [Bacillota bacterium]
MKKHLCRLLAILLLLLFTCIPVQGQERSIQVTLNGSPLTFSPSPVLQDGVTFVPMRPLLEALGYQVDWQGESHTVTAQSENRTLSFAIGENTALVNGVSVPMTTPAYLDQGVTMVPLRFLSEYSGAAVTWDDATSSISITTSRSVQQLAQSMVTLSTNSVQGSGVIVSSDGYIATNFHVMEGADRLQIIFANGQTYHGDWYVAGYDLPRDLVVLKINAQNLTPALLGTNTQPQIGDAVTAIGSPGGQRNVATTGVINGLNDYVLSSTAYITGGSSGGGLFDAAGQLIGIVNAYDTANHYMAIPVSFLAKISLDQYLTPEQWQQVTPEAVPPESLECASFGAGVSFFWAPVYGADYYQIYTSFQEDGPYQKMVQPLTGNSQWRWGFPYSFVLSSFQNNQCYFKISAVVNGKESALSPAYAVTF